MADKLDIIIDLVKETRTEVSHLKEEQIKAGSDISRNADSLELHMKRTDELESLVKVYKVDEDNKFQAADKRLDTLEAPLTAIKMLVKWISVIGTVAGAIYGVGRLMGWL